MIDAFWYCFGGVLGVVAGLVSLALVLFFAWVAMELGLRLLFWLCGAAWGTCDLLRTVRRMAGWERPKR